MREIKFRAWNRKTNSWVDPRQDSLFIFLDGTVGNVDPFCWDGGVTTDKECNSIFEIMQYTGQKDMNSKEIYEGDIIECEYYPNLSTTKDLDKLIFRLKVEYSENHTHYSAIRLDNGAPHSVGFSGSAVKRWEVIGNIFENPELLELPKEK